MYSRMNFSPAVSFVKEGDVMPKIIILRGNSGSGKSTVAKELQKRLGYGILLLSQDYLRREMIYVPDKPGNKAISLLEALIDYGAHNCAFVILEGILYADIYADLFQKIKEVYKDQIYAYYFDISFNNSNDYYYLLYIL